MNVFVCVSAYKHMHKCVTLFRSRLTAFPLKCSFCFWFCVGFCFSFVVFALNYAQEFAQKPQKVLVFFPERQCCVEVMLDMANRYIDKGMSIKYFVIAGEINVDNIYT